MHKGIRKIKLFVIFELCILMAMSSCIGLDLNDPDNNCNYEEEQELIFPTENITKIELDAIAGLLAIKPSPGNNVYLTVTACARAKEDLDRFKINSGVDGTNLKIIFDLSDTYKDITLDLDILVPDSLNLEINDSSGGILIENLENDIYQRSGLLGIIPISTDIDAHQGHSITKYEGIIHPILKVEVG